MNNDVIVALQKERRELVNRLNELGQVLSTETEPEILAETLVQMAYMEGHIKVSDRAIEIARQR